MIAALPNDPLGFLPTSAPTAGTRPSAPDDPLTIAINTLRRDLGTLAAACTETLSKTAQHYHGEDSWVIGPMPGYGPLADKVEAASRAYLANSHLSSSQAELVANTLKMSGDLRSAARGARQAVQLAFLFQHQADRESGANALHLLCTMADSVVAVAEQTSLAIQTDDYNAAHQAAQLFRQVDSLRFQIEAGICNEQWNEYFTPTAQKMIRAAAWNFAVAAEGMARVAARLLMPAA